MTLFSSRTPFGATVLSIVLLCAPAWAQDTETAEQMTPEQQAYMEQALAIWESLNRQTGEIKLGSGFATLNVPEEYYFLDAQDSNTVLVDLWGNPPGLGVLGMLMPAKYTALDGESWAVTIEYVEDGYVSDEDAREVDYDDLLKQMKKDTRESSKYRVKEGYESVELLGWAEPPFYSFEDKKMYWAKSLRFGDETDQLNYDIRALGRKGVLSMTFIAGIEKLDEINAARSTILAMAHFNEGYRYEDFQAGTDKVAAYGIGALVAGAVAKKAGLLAAALLFLKKFGVIIVLGIAAFFGKIKRLFTSKTAE